MKRISKIVLLLFALSLFAGCHSGKNGQKTEYPHDLSLLGVDSSRVEVIYFHNKQRCANCVAVEEVTSDVVRSIDSSDIKFSTYAIGNKASKRLEDTLQIAGPTLLLFHGEKVINLTSSAYLFARIKPEKFRNDLELAIKDLK